MKIVGTCLLLVNLITFCCYGWDKWQACRGGWRISERRLMVLAAAGGTVGAALGQMIFRHKTAKKSFVVTFWTIVVAQLVLLGWIMAKRLG